MEDLKVIPENFKSRIFNIKLLLTHFGQRTAAVGRIGAAARLENPYARDDAGAPLSQLC